MTEELQEDVQTEEVEQDVQSEAIDAETSEVEEVSTEEVPEPTEEVESYEADYTYKLGKETKEFPDYLRSVIQSKEDEENIRDIMTRADGLEVVKSKLTERTEAYEQSNSIVNELVRLRQEDPKALLEKLGLTPDKVLPLYDDDRIVDDWQRREQFNQLPPEAKQQMEMNTRYERENQRYQQQIEEMKDQSFQMMVGVFDQQLESPGVREVKTAYDEIHGDGAFRKECALVADFKSRQLGRLAHPNEFLDEAVSKFRPMIERYTNNNNNTQSNETQPARVETRTIPSVGRATSETPASRKFTSIADIEAYNEQREKMKRG